MQKYYENTSISNICGSVIYEADYEYDVLNNAINAFVALQESMRLQLCVKDGKIEQYAVDVEYENFPFVEFQDTESFRRHALDMAKTPMNLVNHKLYRIEVICINGKKGMLVCLNHIIADAWSFSVLARMVDHYCSSPIDNQAFGYKAFVERECSYLLSKRYTKDKEFWENTFQENYDVCSIKPEAASAVLPTAEMFCSGIGCRFSERIRLYCADNAISSAVLFECALFVYLSKLNPENKNIVIGNVVLNRSTLDEKSAVGMFVSTIPMKVAVSQNMTVSELLAHIIQMHTKMLRHQKYPYSQISEYVHKKHGIDSLYQVMFSYQNAQTGIHAVTEWYSNGYSEVPFSIHIDDRDNTMEYKITIDYQTEIFRREEIEYIYKRLLYVLEQIISNSVTFIDEINIVPKGEFQKLIYDFNDTAVAYSRDKCIHELFTEQAKRMPNKIALVFEGEKFTYQKLDEMSNSLAHYLREKKGVKPNDIVPIIGKRSWHIIVAMLGVLKAGGAYVPIESDYPKDRIKYILYDTNARTVLHFGCGRSEIIGVDLSQFDYSYDTSCIDNVNSIFDCCYMICTSGTTGLPKEVMICHLGILNYLNFYNQIIKSSQVNTILSVNSICFDAFIDESLAPILTGVCVYLANSEQSLFSDSFLELLNRSEPIDAFSMTPAKFRMLFGNLIKSGFYGKYKLLLFGGEVLLSSDYFNASLLGFEKIFNTYGPTETTVGVSFKQVIDVKDITIGKPIANTQFYVLDRNRKLLPIGIAGELCISGDSVGNGYLNNQELTLEKFIPNPFIEGKTMYCTGDLARWRTDGEIEYLGRIDTQIKIRGLRIELGEIESVMSSFDGIIMCAVTDKRDKDNRQYLIGYYTADSEIDEKCLRKHLSAKLPKYMVPNYFVRLDTMPMTVSGKIDSKNLPMPDFSQGKSEFVAPRNETERKLCTLMSQLLKVEDIGITDDFFELGGDSLAAMAFIAEAHNNGIEITLQDLYDHPTIESLIEKRKTKRLFSAEQFSRYVEVLKRSKTVGEVHSKKTLGNVLLTGATGFLGAHLLDALIKQESGKVYCLVRSKEKFIDTLHYYFGELYDDNDRIIPLSGNITDEHLQDILPRDLQTIIHAAANVKHYGDDSEFGKVNVGGTKNLIVFANAINAKLIYISTISVSGNTLVDADAPFQAEKEMRFDETSLYIGQSLENVYIRSKFEAECAVLDAVIDGLDAKIVRIGNLTNRTSDYKFQPNYENNAFLTRICAGLKLGIFPEYLLPMRVEFSPVDETAKGIIFIAQYAKQQTIFHLNNNRQILFSRLIEVFQKLGMQINVVSGNEFHDKLEEMNRDSSTRYIYEAFQNDMDQDGKLIYESKILVVNDKTLCFLHETGFKWSEIDFDYIKGYIDYFRGIGILEV